MASDLTYGERVKNLLQSFTLGDPIEWKIHPYGMWHNGIYRGIGMQQGQVIVEVDDAMAERMKQRFMVIDAIPVLCLHEPQMRKIISM
jgi:hypothetical protein